ncbi:MAG: Nif11 family protein [Candidatus Wallbacteria bacterium]|nr:Nif11 family protein [Candidatus Wallbacteria bacterium]
MSIDHAMRFLDLVRTDESVRRLLLQRGDEPTSKDLIEVAANRGWHFDEKDLQQAFRHAWAMRWMHARAGSRGSDAR